MVGPTERIQTLRDHGLSEYGARAYLALLELGRSEAREIARLARLPMPKIHATLATLHERGLVEMYPESPRQYEPIPFPTFLEHMRQDMLHQVADLERKRETLAALFKVRANVRVNDRGDVTMLRGRRRNLARIQQMMRAEEGALYVAAEGDGATERLAEVAEAARAERGEPLALRVLLPAGAHPKVRARLEAVATVREAASTSQAAILVTPTYAALIHYVPDDASTYTGEDVAVVIDREELVRALSQNAEAAWDAALPVTGVRVRSLD